MLRSARPFATLVLLAATLAFGAAEAAAPSAPAATAFPDVKPGQTVRFAFTQGDDGYRLTKVEPQGGER